MKKTRSASILFAGMFPFVSVFAQNIEQKEHRFNLTPTYYAPPITTDWGVYPLGRIVEEDKAKTQKMFDDFYAAKRGAKKQKQEAYRLYEPRGEKTVLLQSSGNSVGNIVFDIIDEKYYGFIPPKTKALLPQRGPKEMVELLEDPYSEFIPSEDVASRINLFEDQYTGIGVEIVSYKGAFYILDVFSDGPADFVGVKDGDQILSVNGISVEGLSIEALVDLIQGDVGSYVKLSVKRKNKVIPFILKRGVYSIENVTYEVKDGVSVLTLHELDEATIEKVFDIIVNQDITSTKGLVIDLRNNEGGTVKAAVALSEIFTRKNEVLFLTKNKAGEEKQYVSSYKGPLSEMRNIVLLQNAKTASSAEMFIALLQETERAHVIGTHSKGKNVAQELFLLHDGSLLKLTVAQWMTPQRASVSEHGIIPDERIGLGNFESHLKDGDMQMKAALSFLNAE